jgi:hypothetical protein
LGDVLTFEEEPVDVVVCFLQNLVTGKYVCHIKKDETAKFTAGASFAGALFHLTVANLLSVLAILTSRMMRLRTQSLYKDTWALS